MEKSGAPCARVEPVRARNQSLEALADPAGGPRDLVIVGGGATGLGVAVDAASRGYRVALVEARDFASGTSSRSTKLVHGGVRYLEQGDIPLVLEALRERGLLHRNAPHLVKALPFIVPRYRWWEGPFFGVGLKLYDALAGKLNLAPSRILSREDTLARIPNIEPDALLGGVEYFDGQFDDARLAISLAGLAERLGADLINYCPVIGLKKSAGATCGVVCRDAESGREFAIEARVVVNAAGIFADTIRAFDEPQAPNVVQPSQGVHLVFDRSFLQGNSAIMVPHTDDGRVLFVIPWHGHALVGTTDTPMGSPDAEPRALPEEIGFILRNASRYLARDPTPADIRSIFAGQRPLVRPPKADGTATKSISRNHEILISDSGLLTIVGGKWTTYRQMAEDTVNAAAHLGNLEERDCITRTLAIGKSAADAASLPDWLTVYGEDADAIRRLERENPAYSEPLVPGLPYTVAAAIHAVRHEAARTTEDILSRRTRALLLDARAAHAASDAVAGLLARELGRSPVATGEDAECFRNLAKNYFPAD